MDHWKHLVSWGQEPVDSSFCFASFDFFPLCAVAAVAFVVAPEEARVAVPTAPAAEGLVQVCKYVGKTACKHFA